MLPKLSHSIFDITIPSSGKKMKFRQFLVKEEKLLLTAEEGKDLNELLEAVKQVIRNCSINKFDPGECPLFDLEYIFLRLRSRSVSNISEIIIIDNSDKKEYKFDIDLDTIEVEMNPNHKDKIQLSESIGIVMKYPTINLTDKLLKEVETKTMSKNDVDFYITKQCISQIYDNTKLYKPFVDCTEEELDEFLLNLNREQSEKIKSFFETIPKLTHTITYTNSLGEDKTIVLDGISDFFLF